MVNDTLTDNKSLIMEFTNSFVNSENIEFKQILEQLRSNFESFHSELFTLAVSKGYYSPNTKAKPEEINRN